MSYDAIIVGQTVCKGSLYLLGALLIGMAIFRIVIAARNSRQTEDGKGKIIGGSRQVINAESAPFVFIIGLLILILADMLPGSIPYSC